MRNKIRYRQARTVSYPMRRVVHAVSVLSDGIEHERTMCGRVVDLSFKALFDRTGKKSCQRCNQAITAQKRRLEAAKKGLEGK